MPIPDWTRVDAGIFHDFHNAWITELRNALNNGLLPPEFYALTQQFAGEVGPDVLTLEASGTEDTDPSGGKALSVRAAPPQVQLVFHSETSFYVARRKSLTIRHGRGDRTIAIIELVSRGNKSSRARFKRFVNKAVSALARGIHLLIIDLQPPTRRDAQGIHGAIWKEIGDGPYTAPADKPLTLVAYTADPPVTAYVEPVTVSDVLPDMPLFLDPDYYVPVPLEATYQAAWRGVPQRWRAVLEGPAAS